MSDETPNHPPAAVLWDMDGTLVDTEPYWIAAEHQLVEEAGGQWSEELGMQLVGKALMDSAHFIRAHSPVTMEPEEIVHWLLDRVVASTRDHIPWRPGARELLFDVHAAGIPNALVTMSWMPLVEPIIEQLPAGIFSVLATGDRVAHGKPHPEPYLHAARKLNLNPGDCLAVEDSPTGVTSATAAGVPTLAVRHIVDIPQTAGALPLETLKGITAADLIDLRAEAAATFSTPS